MPEMGDEPETHGRHPASHRFTPSPYAVNIGAVTPSNGVVKIARIKNYCFNRPNHEPSGSGMHTKIMT